MVSLLGGDAGGGPVPGVEPVLQVHLGLPDQVVRAHEVPVQELGTGHIDSNRALSLAMLDGKVLKVKQ